MMMMMMLLVSSSLFLLTPCVRRPHQARHNQFQRWPCCNQALISTNQPPTKPVVVLRQSLPKYQEIYWNVLFIGSAPGFLRFFFNSRGVKNAWRWRYLRCPVFTMDVYESTCLLIGAPMDCTDQHFNHSFGQGRNSITASTTYLRDMLHKSYSVAQAIVRCFNKNHGVNLKESIC